MTSESADAVVACCSTVYGSPLAELLVGDSFHPGGLESTRDLLRSSRIGPGARLLDVGCGLGDAARALSASLGASGQVVGIDASAVMLEVARARTAAAICPMRFTVGDALALDEPDGSFDAARSERTLQWVADPRRAVDELARVLRPGGRLALIDTDWSTLRLDVGDDRIASLVRDTMRTERSRPSNIGSRLPSLVRAAGFAALATTAATEVWSSWDPDATPAPAGCFSMQSLVDDLVDVGSVGGAEAGDMVSTIHDAARRGEFSMSLTMFAVVAVKTAERER